jgi:hypothetical protein
MCRKWQHIFVFLPICNSIILKRHYQTCRTVQAEPQDMAPAPSIIKILLKRTKNKHLQTLFAETYGFVSKLCTLLNGTYVYLGKSFTHLMLCVD